jgi:cell division protein FtsB
MVGLWIQTQTLARQGLLLLNITLIEPGYVGPLSAVLVNFGNKKVVIRPDTKIAKVVFLTLDKKADELVEKWDSKTYEAKLLEMAANAPETFLQLETFLPKIEERAKARLMAMDKEIELNVGNIVNEAKFNLEKELGEKMKRSFIRGHIGLFGSFVVVLGAFFFLLITFLPRLTAEYSGIEKLVQKESVVQQAKTIVDLNAQINNLSTEIKFLKKQMQGNATKTTPLPDANSTVPNQ